ncbi:uncharacterized protein EAF01_002899 [Botrytis porri]|uniref:Uncharacterized protein n=1 Tax=Botrytis porri TaxID=87229 RepID=A0A4Z1KEZ8_9HELO|nr:uncharacterized protein EAF01_002899 [Botrytis porri]KAF7911392.1 hypothetical protein EAF01_002899 [Botrytis porri]TGO84621.1 hypothetical protein BPOR_0484g00020 [Botrytis porri]
MHGGYDTKSTGRTGVGGDTTLPFPSPNELLPPRNPKGVYCAPPNPNPNPSYQAFPFNPAEDPTLVAPPAEPATRVR